MLFIAKYDKILSMTTDGLRGEAPGNSSGEPSIPSKFKNDPLFGEVEPTARTEFARFLLERYMADKPAIPIANSMEIVRESIGFLSPTHSETNIHGQVFGISQLIFDGSTKRPHCLIAPLDGAGLPTAYYRSETHGVWRALLAKDSSGWYAKGTYGVENSVDAPIALQRELSLKLDNEGAFWVPQEVEVLQAVAPTGKDENEAGNTAYDVMCAAGILPTGRVCIDQRNSSNLFAPGKRPDFGRPGEQWVDISTYYYEQIVSIIYPSRDGSIIYLVNEVVHEGQTLRWIGTAEVADASVTRLGLLSKFVGMPVDLQKLPLDYSTDADGKTALVRQEKPTRFEDFARRSLAAHQGRRS